MHSVSELSKALLKKRQNLFAVLYGIWILGQLCDEIGSCLRQDNFMSYFVGHELKFILPFTL